MQRLIFGALVLVLIAAAMAWAQTGSTTRINDPSPPSSPWLTYVTNFPDTQNVAGSVTVDNLPTVQQVSGSVDVGNLPAVQSVEVVNFPAPATSAQFQLVGFSSETLPADSGVLGFTLACQSDFPGSRMCLLDEALATVVVPELTGGLAWIRGGGDCLGWTSTDDDEGRRRGLTLNPTGGYWPELCSYVLKVACCAPVE